MAHNALRSQCPTTERVVSHGGDDSVNKHRRDETMKARSGGGATKKADDGVGGTP